MKNIVLNLALFSVAFCIPSVENTEESTPTSTSTSVNSLYAPKIVDCPSNGEANFISNELVPEEKAYSEKRREKVNKALLKFFKKTIGEDEGIDLEDFIENKKLTIGLSFGGSAYRGLLTTVGQISALDERVKNAGPLAGILQSASYISGSDSGGLVLSALMAHDFPNVHELLNSPNTFKFENAFNSDSPLLFPYGEEETEKNQNYWDSIAEQVISKKNAGFPATIIDSLGRTLSYLLLGKENNNQDWINFTLSGVTELDSFKNADMPFPFLISQLNLPAELIPAELSEEYAQLEMSPFTIGSEYGLMKNYIKTPYFGSYTKDGENVCVKNFDNLSFLMGLTSPFFIFDMKNLHRSDNNNGISYSNNASLFDIHDDDTEREVLFASSLISPDDLTNSDSLSEKLIKSPYINDRNLIYYLPFFPYDRQGAEERDVDVIFTFNNIDEDLWLSNGTPLPKDESLYRTYGRSNYKRVPQLPTDSEYVFRNETTFPSPAFFGCHESTKPVLIYVPNSYYIENITMPDDTVTIFSDEEVNLLVENGRVGASLDKGKFKDDDWATCVACVMLNHNYLKHGDNSELPTKCTACLQKYCKPE